MKKILVVGASVLQLPAIKKAKEMGLYVAVADYNPKAIGISYADKFYEVSTIDEKGIYEAAKDLEADGIMTLATDMPMRAIAYAVERLELTGITYDTAMRATDKGEMIKTFESAGVAHPWYFILQSPAEILEYMSNISFPCVTKPIDNSGSRGVVLVNSKEDLVKAVEYSYANGRKGGVIIEEYLQGNEVSVEVIVINGIVHVLQVTDKLTTGAPHFVEMGHSQPSRLDKKAVNAIQNLAKRAVISLGIDNSPAHVEIMLTQDGPKMIELGARMGGDCIASHLVPLSTGIDMVQATIEIALGMKPDITPKFHRGASIRYIREQLGTIKAILGIEEAQKVTGVQEIILTKSIGDYVGKIDSSIDRIGSVICQGETAETAVKYCEEALSKIAIKVE